MTMRRMDPLRVAPRVPWHMWGNTERFELTIGAGGSREEVGQQLCKVSYRRPENWRFFFGGRLLGGVAGVGGNIDVYALFDLQIGVGRSVFDTQNERFTQFRSFCTMHWRVPAGTIPGASRVWCSATSSSALSSRRRSTGSHPARASPATR